MGVEYKTQVLITVQYCGTIAVCDSYVYTKYSVHFYNIGIYHPFLIKKKNDIIN